MLQKRKEIKRLNQVLEEERNKVESFRTQTRALREECESLKKLEQQNISLKSKLRKQIDSDLLLVSLGIIAKMLGITKSKEPLSDLQTRQAALMQQQQALQPSQYGNIGALAALGGLRGLFG